jgi:hypothetical protein
MQQEYVTVLEVPDPTVFNHSVYAARFEQIRAAEEKRLGAPVAMIFDDKPKYSRSGDYWFVAAVLSETS